MSDIDKITRYFIELQELKEDFECEDDVLIVIEWLEQHYKGFADIQAIYSGLMRHRADRVKDYFPLSMWNEERAYRALVVSSNFNLYLRMMKVSKLIQRGLFKYQFKAKL